MPCRGGDTDDEPLKEPKDLTGSEPKRSISAEDGTNVEATQGPRTATDKCGDNAYWSFASDGTLTISGTGAIWGYLDYPSDIMDEPRWGGNSERIESIIIEEGITEIDDHAFDECTELIDAVLPEGLQKIGSWAFGSCENLTRINLPNGLKTIGDQAFIMCTRLSDLRVPDSVNLIGAQAFAGCKNLSSIRIPDGITTIWRSTFSGCTALTYVELPNSVTSIRDHAFAASGLTSIYVPSSVKDIEDYAFDGCMELSDVYYSGSESEWNAITIIEGNDPLLNSVIHYNSYPQPGEKKFISGVLRYGDNCEVLWECTYYLGTDGQATKGELEIYTSPTGGEYTDEELYLYNEKVSSGFPFPWETEPYNLPKSAITRLEIRGEPLKRLRVTSNAFRGYDNLQQLLLQCVSAVDANAFEGCTSLVTVNLDDEVAESIGAGAFMNCTNLERATLGKSITNIGEDAFSGCENLVIYCYQDSCAHQYAQENKISFVIMLEKGQNNQLDFSKDVWGFDNFGDIGSCLITDTDMATLLTNLSPSEKNELRENIQMGTSGHCYGMSSTAILNKMNDLHVAGICGATTLRSVKESLTVTHSIIGYWQATQLLKAPRTAVQSFMDMSTQDQLVLLAKKADAVKNGGCPVLFSYGWYNIDDKNDENAWAHAVVAYALESGSFKSSKSGKTYDHRVLIYDCNVVSWNWKADNCLLFNEGTDEWEIPYYYYNGATSTDSGAYLKRCVSTLEMINVKDYNSGRSNSNYIAELRCENETEFQMVHSDGRRWLINAAKGIASGDTDLMSYSDSGFLPGSNVLSPLNVVLPDESAAYTLTPASDDAAAMDISVLYDDRYLSVSSDSAREINLGENEPLSLKGNKGTFAVAIADDNIRSGAFNTYNVTGDSEGDITLDLSDEGCTIKGDNLAGIVVTAREGDIVDVLELPWNMEDTDIKSVDIKRVEDELMINGTTTFNVTFDANGGTVTPETMTTDENGKLADLPVPVRKGYRFDGWFTSADGGNQVTMNAAFIDDTVVYAQWTYVGSSHHRPSHSGSASRPSGSSTVSKPSDDSGRKSKTDDEPEQDTEPEEVPSNVWQNPFTDVAESSWYYDAVRFVSESGLMTGTKPTLFAPETVLTRAMLAQILYQQAGSPAVSGSSPFVDVPAAEWYTDAVIWASQQSLVSGYSSGVFAPNDPITREQLAVILWRHANQPSEPSAELLFADAAVANSYAVPALRWAVGAELISGMSGNRLAPSGVVTRAQAAQMLKNYLQ